MGSDIRRQVPHASTVCTPLWPPAWPPRRRNPWTLPPPPIPISMHAEHPLLPGKYFFLAQYEGLHKIQEGDKWEPLPHEWSWEITFCWQRSWSLWSKRDSPALCKTLKLYSHWACRLHTGALWGWGVNFPPPKPLSAGGLPIKPYWSNHWKPWELFCLHNMLNQGQWSISSVHDSYTFMIVHTLCTHVSDLQNQETVAGSHVSLQPSESFLSTSTKIKSHHLIQEVEIHAWLNKNVENTMNNMRESSNIESSLAEDRISYSCIKQETKDVSVTGKLIQTEKQSNHEKCSRKMCIMHNTDSRTLFTRRPPCIPVELLSHASPSNPHGELLYAEIIAALPTRVAFAA